MKFQLIDKAKNEFPVHRLCGVLGVSQSGYFAWKDRSGSRRQRDDMVLLAHVRSAFALSNGTYGSPRMTREPAGMHGKECQPEKSYRRAGRSGKPVRPSLYSKASSEGSGSLTVFQGSSPITSPSHLQKHVKSRGPFLHRHCPASTVLWPRPTPAWTAALDPRFSL